jgi:tetratricopeptide (TPR) repeat protein
MRSTSTILLLSLVALVACFRSPDRQTLAELRGVEPDLAEVQIDDGIEQAMVGYRKFLEEAPKSTLTPEAMRRLADLKLEKEFGLQGHSGSAELPAPEITRASPERESSSPASLADASIELESRRDFEQRATGDGHVEYSASATDLALPGGDSAKTDGPLEAIELYDQILEAYPNYPNNDQVLYQKARAFDELGRNDEAIAVTEILVSRYPHSSHIDEVQFRRAEYFFTRKKYFDAEDAYGAIVARGSDSDYYELALYKLGWTLYKQMMLEEALEQYITLLDYKVSLGYDFDQTEDEADQSRVTDTYRVISLCFSDLGGTESVASFFATLGPRSYEHRVYRQIGEFYLEKLRFADAASAYEKFVDLHPYHDVAPHFSMRVVEIYEAGGFPKLVLEAKKSFAADYGMQSKYWKHFDIEESPEVVTYLKLNLTDLANHYHALYQSEERLEDKPAHFAEAARWYRAYLSSFATDPEAPAIHYQLADLHLENQDFGVAALEYEHIAYEYPEHDKASDAGYAAIFAHRKNLDLASEDQSESVRRQTVESSLRFVDRFPSHENAAAVLGAATDDLYALKDYEQGILIGQRLISEYPTADPAIIKSSWTVIAHSSFDLLAFEQAEAAYSQVLEMTPTSDDSYQGVVDNLAAAIYKQGEKAKEAGEFRFAADHFLRIAKLAPSSKIRPIAQYDAGTVLIELEDWNAAGVVFESFRTEFPAHELSREATRQIAFVYREDGNPSRAAEEYERVAAEADEPDLRREALLAAGGLYEDAHLSARALAVYQEYVTKFTSPIEPVAVTRFKMAKIYQETGDVVSQEAELKRIIQIDAGAGDERSDVVRTIAAKSALTLTEKLFRSFDDIELRQPFEANLEKKQRRMDIALRGFEELIDYEVGEVTAASTFYMAEIYAHFSSSLLDSERPGDLTGSDLQDYEMVLEEEAYPFEERAIEFHEKNLELMAVGVYNEWIEKSLANLAVVMPGRYAKFEESSGFVESVDTYAYHAPKSRIDSEFGDSEESDLESQATDISGTSPEQTVVTETAEAEAIEGESIGIAGGGDVVEGDAVADDVVDVAIAKSAENAEAIDEPAEEEAQTDSEMLEESDPVPAAPSPGFQSPPVDAVLEGPEAINDRVDDVHTEGTKEMTEVDHVEVD